MGPMENVHLAEALRDFNGLCPHANASPPGGAGCECASYSLRGEHHCECSSSKAATSVLLLKDGTQSTDVG